MSVQKIVNTNILNNGISRINKAVSAFPQELKVFFHHIYEYKKGLRDLILTTEKSYNRKYIEDRLKKEKIAYRINEVTPEKINVFFGDATCIKVVEGFDKSLSKLSPEEDFILGTMLGYSKLQQCERYLKLKNKAKL